MYKESWGIRGMRLCAYVSQPLPRGVRRALVSPLGVFFLDFWVAVRLQGLVVSLLGPGQLVLVLETRQLVHFVSELHFRWTGIALA